MSDRSEFEKVIQRLGYVPAWDGDSYLYEEVEVAWQAWQAARHAPACGEVEPVAWMRWRSHRIAADDVVEGLEICEPEEVGDDGGPAFPVYTHPTPYQSADENVAWWKEHLSVHLATLFRANGQSMKEAERSAAQVISMAEKIAPNATPHPAPSQAVPEIPKGENGFGLDARYFHEKLRLILRDIGSYTPTEMARALGRLAITADSETMREPEFNIGGLIDEPKYREDGHSSQAVRSGAGVPEGFKEVGEASLYSREGRNEIEGDIDQDITPGTKLYVRYTQPTNQAPDGYVLVEKGITPTHVAEAGLKCFRLLNQSGIADDRTIVLAVFQDMLLAASNPPAEGEG